MVPRVLFYLRMSFRLFLDRFDWGADITNSLGASPRLCFEKYVDVRTFMPALVACSQIMQAMIDLLLPGQSPGIKETIVDLYGKPELLFFGPDEGTADLMDWAARA